MHAALPDTAVNDRPSADFNQPREDYAVVAKEMAKAQSLAASFRNISQYLSLIERARNTIQGVKAKLTELDDTISEAAKLIDSDDYNLVPIGAISEASISGLASGSGTFTAISPTATSGNGAGSLFTINTEGYGNYNIVNIDAAGTHYGSMT